MSIEFRDKAGLLVLALADVLAQAAFLAFGVEWASAQFYSFLVVLILGAGWCWIAGTVDSSPILLAWLGVVASIGLVLRAAVGAVYLSLWAGEPIWAVLGSAVTLMVVLYAGFHPVDDEWSEEHLRNIGYGHLILKLTPLLVLALVLVRLLYMPLLNLMSQEAYYWKYAENLSIGYLDHPPAVAVLIAFGQAAFGINEFGVRSGAMLCWLLMVYFTSRLTFEWFGRAAALVSILLLSLLPFHSAMGFFITPDAPLVATWAGALYFLHRVFLRQQGVAWYGVGLCIGLGMLSKYPMVLIGPAIALFMLLDRQSRHWFLKPQPYTAALLALLIFSPVLFWNANNDWASFAFQGPRRFQAEREISTHLLIAFYLLLLTPLGAWFTWLLFSPERVREKSPIASLVVLNKRLRLFVAIFAFAPIAVFLYASFSQEIKVNWIGPALLVLVPVLALPLVPEARLMPAGQRMLVRVQKGWLMTGAVLIMGMAGVLYYLGIGLPGLPYGKAMKKFIGWETLGAEIARREELIASRRGTRPIVMGADSHYVGSQVGFYRAKVSATRGDPLPEPSQGRSLLGASSLMYRFWSKPDAYLGRDVLMVSRTRSDVEDQVVGPFFLDLEPIEEIAISRKGRVVQKFYVRLGEHYRGAVR